MSWWYVPVILLGIALIIIVLVATLRARSLDIIHKNVTKSRVSLERALVDRAQAAVRVATSGQLDMASSVLLADVANNALLAAGYPIVDDGLEALAVRPVDAVSSLAPNGDGYGKRRGRRNPASDSSVSVSDGRYCESPSMNGISSNTYAPPTQSADMPDRLVLESELSRALRYTVDELADNERDDPAITELNQRRVAVQMTRRFHNNHVAQARRVRKSKLVRVLRLAGNAPEPRTVNLDDE
ncbi:hypothetical protein [Trueperella sp. LYQ141]|uniref:hypothetical protein n=1 Tax=Trueperella sp. LYQ141 TaxID=3391058 RepID=UPI0039838E72